MSLIRKAGQLFGTAAGSGPQFRDALRKLPDSFTDVHDAVTAVVAVQHTLGANAFGIAIYADKLQRFVGMHGAWEELPLHCLQRIARRG